MISLRKVAFYRPSRPTPRPPILRRPRSTPSSRSVPISSNGRFLRVRLQTRAGDAERTSCGLILTGKSFGVTHPVLPCGAKLLLRFGGQTVLTEVIDNKLKSAGRQFELTERLARDLGLNGTQEIDWRFAARP